MTLKQPSSDIAATYFASGENTKSRVKLGYRYHPTTDARTNDAFL